ncbi:MAG: hypothetical protein IPK32_21055 [Verrucomicrobiaceae bacterium]|nr:hypothetical protein [Verrucomicrobiaceae bacterium]
MNNKIIKLLILLAFILNDAATLAADVKLITFKEFKRNHPEFSILAAEKSLMEPDPKTLAFIFKDLGHEGKSYNHWFTAFFGSTKWVVYVLAHTEIENHYVLYRLNPDTGEPVEKCFFLRHEVN